MKKTLYEILGVVPSADDAAIAAAYRRLTQQHAALASRMDPDADIQIKLIKEAYSTLSDYGRRSSYDASLMARANPTRVAVEIHEPRSFQKTLLLIIGSLIAIGMTIQIGFMLMSYRYANNSLAEAQENKVRLREYEMEMGAPKSASEIEAQRLAAEQRREEQALSTEQRRLANEERERERKLEEERRYASRISDERIHTEEQAQRKTEYEKKRVEQDEIQRKQQEEYAAKRQIENEKRRLQELQSQNQR